MFPGDPNGEPEEVIECRCTVLPFFEEVEPTEEEIASEREAIQELIAQAQSGVTEEVEMA
jgi:hypothetical protein